MGRLCRGGVGRKSDQFLVVVCDEALDPNRLKSAPILGKDSLFYFER